MTTRFSDYLTEASPKPFWTDKNKIEKFLSDHQILDICTIHNDGVVDVHHGLALKHFSFEMLPIQFGRVDGFFSISEGPLKSLRGCPKIVEHSFMCQKLKITDLVGGPEKIGGNYTTGTNVLLKSLKGLEKCQGIERFFCTNSGISDLSYIPEYVDSISVGNNVNLTSLHNIHLMLPNLENLFITCRHTKSHVLGILMLKKIIKLTATDPAVPKWFKILKEYSGKGRAGVLAAQEEMIEAGDTEYAKL